MADSFFLFGLAVWVVSLIVAWMIGDARGRPGAGFFCGFMLGPLGCVAALFLPKEAAPVTGRRPGQPTQRHHRLPFKGDPVEEWERRQGGR
jgi:hypothetical protein